VHTLLDAVAMVPESVRLAYLWRPLLTDTDDDMVLETAINGRAKVLARWICAISRRRRPA